MISNNDPNNDFEDLDKQLFIVSAIVVVLAILAAVGLAYLMT